MKRNHFGWLKNKIIIIFVIISSVYVIYGQSFTFDFINFDDPVYVTDNPAVKHGLGYESLKWAFGIHGDICMYYQPLAWISHMADCQWFGLDPGKHHRTSVILHGINAVLLFLILNSMTGAFWRSAFAAGIFTLHPVNTDAVVWISERKTVLSAFFWLLSMGLYIRYTRRPSTGRMIPVVIIFSLGMFTKPVLITFPFAMILMDIWPLDRVQAWPNPSMSKMLTLFLEKIPLFLVILLWCITPYLSRTLLANETTPDIISYGLRISNVFVSYSKYVITFFFPFHLSILYPYPESIPFLKTLTALFFLSGVTVYGMIRFKARPYLLIGWLWFTGTLFPTSGLILGTLWPEMADRWAYIPYIGLAVITAWGLPELLSRYQTLKRYLSVGLAVVFLVYMGILAHKQTGYWKNSIRIFEKALTVIDYHALPHLNIASEWIKKGAYDRAEKHLEIILKNEPDNVDALYNMGLCLFETNRFDQASNYFDTVLSRDPSFTRAYLLKARILEQKGQDEDVISLYRQSLDHTLKQNDILLNLALMLSRKGHREEAEQRFIELISAYPLDHRGFGAYADFLLARRSYEKALHYAMRQTGLTPYSAEARNRAGLCYIHLGRFHDAIEEFRRAIDMDEHFIEARANLETALTDQADLNRAYEAIRKRLALSEGETLPSNPDKLKQVLDTRISPTADAETILIVYGSLAGIYRIYGRYEKALALYKSLLENHPNHETSLNYNIACLYALRKQPEEAVSHLNHALKNDPSLVNHVEKDRDFDSIRQNESFKSCLKSHRLK